MRNIVNQRKKEEGITLIALVITIIILLILAAVAIAMLTGENGLIAKAIKAKDETKINAYKEEIELTRGEVRLQKENYETPTLQDMKEALDKKEWKKQETEIIQDEEDNQIEKLKLITKEEYIFYVTETGVEYKGKGEIKDTSALQQDDAVKLEIVGNGNNGGKLVKITDMSGKEEGYYEIEYQIGSDEEGEGKWTKIKSGETVEVMPSQTIYARLTFGSSKGRIVQLSTEATAPTVVAKNIDTSNYARKTGTELGDLFEKTWGSDGTGEISYRVTGNLKFQNKVFESSEITSLAELELGTYTVTCKMTSPSNKEATATKENVVIGKLAPTTVEDENGNNIDANAIYSEYDLAHFRDLVNQQEQFEINAKLMNDINLANVCSASVGNWEPMGGNNFTIAVGNTISYNGIFDGKGYKIENLYINDISLRRQGLFSRIGSKGRLKNIEVFGNITANSSARNLLWQHRWGNNKL